MLRAGSSPAGATIYFIRRDYNMEVSKKIITCMILVLFFVIAPLSGILIAMSGNGDVIMGYIILITMFVILIFLFFIFIFGIMELFVNLGR